MWNEMSLNKQPLLASIDSFEQDDRFCFPDTTSIIVSIGSRSSGWRKTKATQRKQCGAGAEVFLRGAPFVSYEIASSYLLTL